MERLTERLGNKVINVKYASQHETAIHRLAAIEDILGDDYDLDRLRELAQAEKEGRCVELPAGGFSDQDGEKGNNVGGIDGAGGRVVD